MRIDLESRAVAESMVDDQAEQAAVAILRDVESRPVDLSFNLKHAAHEVDTCELVRAWADIIARHFLALEPTTQEQQQRRK